MAYYIQNEWAWEENERNRERLIEEYIYLICFFLQYEVGEDSDEETIALRGASFYASIFRTNTPSGTEIYVAFAEDGTRSWSSESELSNYSEQDRISLAQYDEPPPPNYGQFSESDSDS